MTQRNAEPSWQYSYVSDGLVFQLDGADSSTMTATSWTDKAGGLVMGNLVPEINGSGFDFSVKNGLSGAVSGPSISGILFNSYSFAASEDYTVEAVFNTPSNGEFFISGTANNSPMIYINGRNVTFLQHNSQYQYGSNLYGSVKAISCNLDQGYCDGTAMALTSSDFWATYNGILVGPVRSISAGTTLSIYAIRLYNRRLTSTEQLQNQQADNERFNLGLTISV